MKANELMLGDLVRFKWPHPKLPPNIVSIFGIVYSEVSKEHLVHIVLKETGSVQYNYDPGVFEGVPLTPEILEKNGFKIDKNETYCKRFFFACNLDKVPQTVVEFSFYGEGVSADTLFKCWTKPKSCDGENSIHICNIKSVHELQHALRLCGIEKEIEL